MDLIELDQECRRCGEPLNTECIKCPTCEILLCADCRDELTIEGKCYCPSCHNLTPSENAIKGIRINA